MLAQYQRAQVETASPTQLVVLLYDGAIRFCSLAVEAIQVRDREAQHINLVRAQRILSELMSSLNHKNGGEVAGNLMRLYTYLYEQLVMANLKDSVAPIQQVLSMLHELRETWSEIDRQATLNGVSSGLEAPGDRALTNTVSSVKSPQRLGDQRA